MGKKQVIKFVTETCCKTEKQMENNTNIYVREILCESGFCVSSDEPLW
jgi:hypothetical protein